LLIWSAISLWPALLSQGSPTIRLLEVLVVLCLILGIAGRVMAIAALVILGLHQAAAPLDWVQYALIILHTNLLFLGTGAFSLWPVEDRLIYRRIGDPH
jgi:uncharacterized membrane protein YphA (DoxX/SURF4 family)